MFYLILLVFFVVKTFFNQYDFLLSILLGSVALVLLYKRNPNAIPLYFLALLTNSSLFILVLNLAVFVLWISSKVSNQLRFATVELYYLVVVVILSGLLLHNHASVHDFLRYALMISAPAIFMLYHNFNFPLQRERSKLLLVFITCTVSNLIYTMIFHSGQRGSIFVGSENIALIILSLVFLLVLSQKNTKKISFLCLILFALSLLTMSSRSVVIVPLIFIASFIFSQRWRLKMVVAAIVCSVVLVAGVNTYKDEILSSQKAQRVLSGLSDLDIQWSDFNPFNGEQVDLSSLEQVDVRARIYAEAIYIIQEKPWFGHGVTSPKVFTDAGKEGVSSFHSSFFDTWITYGFVGLVALFLQLFVVYRFVLKRNREQKVFINCMFFTFVILSMLQPYVFNIQVYSLLFFIFFLIDKSRLSSNVNRQMLKK